MQIFGQRYLDFRNANILPLTGYGIPLKDVTKWDFKNSIVTNIRQIYYIKDSDFSIDIDKSVFYNSLLADIELFYTRSIIQYCDFAISLKKTSEVWSFVSFYYHCLFTAITLLKINEVNLTHLTKTHTTHINTFYSITHGALIKIKDGDYSVKIDQANSYGNTLRLIFTEKDKGGIHKHCWLEIDRFLRLFYKGAIDDEKAILGNCIDILNSFSPTFPSELRNNLNYTNIYGLISLTKGIYVPEIQTDRIKMIKNFFSTKKSKDINDKIYAVYNFNVYLASLLSKLYSDYSLRSNFGKDFQKARNNYLIDKGISIPFLDNF